MAPWTASTQERVNVAPCLKGLRTSALTCFKFTIPKHRLCRLLGLYSVTSKISVEFKGKSRSWLLVGWALIKTTEWNLNQVNWDQDLNKNNNHYTLMTVKFMQMLLSFSAIILIQINRMSLYSSTSTFSSFHLVSHIQLNAPWNRSPPALHHGSQTPQWS
jgi:hypothetical protein